MVLHELLSDRDPLASPLLDLLETSFPPEERETRDEALRQLRDQDGLRSWALVEDDELIGLARGLADAQSGCAWIIHLALKPYARGGGRGADAFHQLVNLWRSELGEAYEGVYLEVERIQDATSDEERVGREKRLNFFRRLGAETLCQGYLQPPSAPGNPTVTLNLLWVGKPIEDKEEAIRRFYRIAFQLPPTHEWVIASLATVADRPA